MFDVLAAAITHLLQYIYYTLTLASELQGVQQPGGPTDRHCAFQRRLQLVCLYQRCGAGEQQARVVESQARC
jgi:hypothetical protein